MANEVLIPLFFLIAMIYSMVGFGGGSSYIALLVLFGIGHTIIPQVALICNLIVVTGGTYYFIKNKQVPWKLILPFLMASIPLSYLGGTIPISKEIYQGVLGFLLLFISLRLLLSNKIDKIDVCSKDPKVIQSLFIGGFVGFISGLVGIGGGIFLSPILYLLKWATPKQIAASASVFIFVNSLSGLAGQLYKSSFNINVMDFSWPFIAVFIGGQIGSRYCNFKLSQNKIKKLTGLLILFVSTRLIYNLL